MVTAVEEAPAHKLALQAYSVGMLVVDWSLSVLVAIELVAFALVKVAIAVIDCGDCFRLLQRSVRW